MSRLIEPGHPDYPPDDVLAAACRVRDWMEKHDCVQLNGLYSTKYVQEVRGHLVKIMVESWAYVHAHCTIQSVFKLWQDARDFCGRPH